VPCALRPSVRRGALLVVSTNNVSFAVAAMKAGSVDYLTAADEGSLRSKLAIAMAECHGTARPAARAESAASRVARLTPREREVLLGLVEGGTNKTIGQALGVSPRTVELHRAHVMDRLNADSLTELLQIAMTAGINPVAGAGRKRKDRQASALSRWSPTNGRGPRPRQAVVARQGVSRIMRCQLPAG
jgi:DNA-binding NarL/FixJ family response regulator